jgi:two-component system phosphate regulon response regulator PhoB
MGRSTGKFPVTRTKTGKQRIIARRTLLLIDDEVDTARLINKIFDKLGYRILISTDGEEGLQRAAEELPDMILLDLRLPKLDGWEVCRRLKANPATRGIPVMMMTSGEGQPAHAAKALAMGAEEYLVKPFVREVIVHNVERILAKR